MAPGCGTILAVEDSDTDFIALQYALKSAGVTNPVERCANGTLAMDLLNRDSCPLTDKASLVLLDLNLPGVDGRQVLKALRRRDPGRAVPVIVLTTSSHPRDIDDSFRAGADAYTVKPLELDDWETKVASLATHWLQAAQRAQALSHPAHLGERRPSRGERRLIDVEQLTRAIENEIIPRLLLAHVVPGAAPGIKQPVPADTTPFDSRVSELAGLALQKDVDLAAAYVESMRERGESLETVFQTLVAPAARLVGDLWKSNICSATEFTEALERLQQLLVELSPDGSSETCH